MRRLEIIKDLDKTITDASIRYKVNKYLIGAILMDEIERLDFVDGVQDYLGRIVKNNPNFIGSIITILLEIMFLGRIENQSFGISQMNVGTLIDLNEYLGFKLDSNKRIILISKCLNILLTESLAPELVSAMIRKTIDHWNNQGIKIQKRIDVCGSLYSMGLEGPKGIHENPQPNKRGLKIQEMAYYLKETKSV